MGRPFWTAMEGMLILAGEAEPVELAAGWYEARHRGDVGAYLRVREVQSDTLVKVSRSQSEQMESILERFWQAEAEYAKRNILHRRGVLLHGEPGSGKSALISEVCRGAIESHDGLVIMPTGNIYILREALLKVRKVDPERKLLVLLEDIEQYLVNDDGDSQEELLLNLLSGTDQLDHCIVLATTNYIDKLPARFTNRPSRFDEVVELQPFDERERQEFIAKFAQAGEEDLCLCSELAQRSAGYGVAHLKELVVSTFCLNEDPNHVVKRLDAMIGTSKKNKEVDKANKD